MSNPDEIIPHQSKVEAVIDDEIERLGGGGSGIQSLGGVGVDTPGGELHTVDGSSTPRNILDDGAGGATVVESLSVGGLLIVLGQCRLGDGTMVASYASGNPRNTLDDGSGGSFFEGLMTQGFAEDYERLAAPPAPSNGFARVFCQDNGSGKHQLAVRFPTGAIQVLATEP